MSDNKPRTATEVLLALEERVKRLEGFIQNDDMLLKQNLNLLNQLNQKLAELSEASKKLQVAAVQVPVAPTPPTVPQATIGKRIISAETVDEPPQIPAPPRTPTIPQPPIKKPEKKRVDTALGTVNVSQVIQYPDGKRVLYADVKIYNSNGELATSSKTNTAGRWTKDLIPGTYKVKVDKLKPPISLEYNITVYQSDIPIEIESPEIKTE